MPEGDTIATYALRLSPLLTGRTIQSAESRWPGAVRQMAGTTVEGVRPVGKNLLIELSDGTVLRVHLGMHGTWHRYAPGEAWMRSREWIALALETEHDVLVCFSAPTVDRFEARNLPLHPVLSALGPDLLGSFDLDEVAARALQRGGPLGEVLLDQRVAAGIGNVYKCELAFVFGLDPFGDVSAIGPDRLRELYGRAATWLRDNVGRVRNTTGRARPSHWVYGRAGRPCLRCGTRIAARSSGQDLPRITFWCPRCQQRPDDGPQAMRRRQSSLPSRSMS